MILSANALVLHKEAPEHYSKNLGGHRGGGGGCRGAQCRQVNKKLVCKRWWNDFSIMNKKHKQVPAGTFYITPTDKWSLSADK